MTMATGLVLAIAVGAMAQNSGALIAYFTGEVVTTGEDDQFTVRAGNNQLLDVRANDAASGPVRIVSQPMCGTIRSTIDGSVEYVESGTCEGEISFSYCVEVDNDGEPQCDPYNVALSVVNLNPQTQTASTPIVTTPATPVETVVVVEPVETAADEPDENATARINVQGDRQTPGQILLQDDQSDIVIAGFNSASSPSLFTPSMEELIQPQETVAILRRSTEALAPSRIDLDQNIQTQSSTATPRRTETTSATLSGGTILGTENSPMVAFASPVQPSLMRSPMLAPSSPVSPGSIFISTAPDVIERAPTANTNTPVQSNTVVASANNINEPIDSNSSTDLQFVDKFETDSVSGIAASADTSAAQTGDVQVVTSEQSTNENGGTVVASIPSIEGAPETRNPSTLASSRDTVVVGVGPEVAATSPDGLGEPESFIDTLVASILGTDGKDDNTDINLESDVIAAASASDAVGDIENEASDAGTVSVKASDPSDSSDIVVEMAAQILLPSTFIDEAAVRALNVSPTPDAVLTDEIFAADLTVSEPPAAGEVEVASITTGNATLANPNSSNARCDVIMSASARPGAAISVFVNSPCRAGQVVTLEHSDFSFSTKLNGSGTLAVTIPAFANLAVLSASFDDGGFAESRLIVRDANEIERLAVMWTIDVDMDLHAFEADAVEGSDGHVWKDNARTFRDTLTGGGGFWETYGDDSIAGGTMAEVYSLPTNRLRERAIVSMDLHVNEIGNNCGNSMLLWTVRLENRGEVSTREFNLALPDCSTSAAGIILENFVSEISVTRR